MVRDLLARRFKEVGDGVQLHVRITFSYLGNGWTDCAEVSCVVRDPLVMRLGTGARTQLCAPLFRISGTAERIVLKLGACLGDR